jgi:hypothetical protein
MPAWLAVAVLVVPAGAALLGIVIWNLRRREK